MTRHHLLRLLAGTAALGACGGEDAAAPDIGGVTITQGPPDSLAPGDIVQLAAVVTDGDGRTIAQPSLRWLTSDVGVVRIAPGGQLTAVAEGDALVRAVSYNREDTAAVRIRIAAASIELLVPGPTQLDEGATVRLTAAVRALNGDPLPNRAVTWSSDAPAMTVDASTGLALAVQDGPAVIRASYGAITAAVSFAINGPITQIALSEPDLILGPSDSISGLTAVALTRLGQPPAFRSVTPVWTVEDPALGRVVVQSGVAQFIATGSGTTRLLISAEGVTTTIPVRTDGVRFVTVETGLRSGCGLDSAGTAYCWGSGPVSPGLGPNRDRHMPGRIGGHTFASLRVEQEHACGLTTIGEIYCWGAGNYGALGSGTQATQLQPALIAFPGRFESLDATFWLTCGVGVNRVGYCWGTGAGGENVPERLTPTPVLGLPPISAIAAGYNLSCALDLGGGAWCWGWNSLGDGQPASSWRAPVAVAGGRSYVRLSVGVNRACGLTANGEAWCWGESLIGDGTTAPALVPVQVGGTARYTRMAVGTYHTCAIEIGGALACWGRNDAGQLGDGSFTDRLVPTPVASSGSFTEVTATDRGTCALEASGRWYCFGDNRYGQFGGPVTGQLEPLPRPVFGQP